MYSVYVYMHTSTIVRLARRVHYSARRPLTNISRELERGALAQRDLHFTFIDCALAQKYNCDNSTRARAHTEPHRNTRTAHTDAERTQELALAAHIRSDGDGVGG